MEVAKTILQQLGGNKFIAMTGSKNFIADNNTLKMSLVKNISKANRLYITLDKATDTYIMQFIKYTAPKLDKKTYSFSDEKIETICEYEDVYCDQLSEIFTAVTKLETRFPQIERYIR